MTLVTTWELHQVCRTAGANHILCNMCQVTFFMDDLYEGKLFFLADLEGSRI
jgi:hypothetical protein